MSEFVWVIGSPRSGTTYVTDYLGKYADKVYNEPWDTHPLANPNTWVFPENKKIVFKYCENWRNLAVLLKYPNSLFVHVWRDPNNVVYSMAYPKAGSYPPRNLYSEYNGSTRLWHCMERWYSNMVNCLSVFNVVKRYVEVRYENIRQELSQLTDLSKPLDFRDRNIQARLDWEAHPLAQGLRNVIKEYDGDCLASWVNKKCPKLLRRAIL